MIASRRPTAGSLAGPIVSSRRVSLVAVAGRAEGAVKDAMQKEKKLGRKPLFVKNRQYLRLRAEPQPLERGCAWELLLLCTERIVSATTGSADLHRWLDAHDVPPQDRVAQGACSASLRSWRPVLVRRFVKDTSRQEQTVSAPGYGAGTDLHRKWWSGELALEVRAAGSKRCCDVRTSPLTHTLHLGENLETSCNVEETSRCCNVRY